MYKGRKDENDSEFTWIPERMLYPIPGVPSILSHMSHANSFLYLITPSTSITVEASGGLIYTCKTKWKSGMITGEIQSTKYLG